MKILDLDMDYFIKKIATFISEYESKRLPDDEYKEYVWSETEVRNFIENNLGLSKEKKIRGRVVAGHNEALFYWKELIERQQLSTPFEVIHVDSHADLGLGYSSWTHIMKNVLEYPVEERPVHVAYKDTNNRLRQEGIGDYLLFALSYRWISKLVYCGNPAGKPNDYLWFILKDFKERPIWKEPVQNTIQLLYNPNKEYPSIHHSDYERIKYINECIKEPEVPFLIIPTVEDVQFDGSFDFAVLAQSPNYTPASADFIIDIFREYIIEE